MDEYEIETRGRSAIVRSRVAGEAVIVERTSSHLALRFPGRRVFGGQGRPRVYAAARYEVFAIVAVLSEDLVVARHVISFSSLAHQGATGS